MIVPPVHTVSAAESLGDLVRWIADRDQAAFSRLYHRLVRSVFLQVGESLGSPAGAVPVTRAVFVEVWRLAPVSDARRDDVLVWITGIAARRAGEKLREIDHHSSAVGTDYDGHFDRELRPASVPSSPHCGPRPLGRRAQVVLDLDERAPHRVADAAGGHTRCHPDAMSAGAIVA